MGGQNHQPCRKYLAISTLMSRAASLAFIEFQLANVALEDLLLIELNDEIGNIDDILKHLNLSSEHLQTLQATMQDLRAEMDIQKYQDLPTLNRINLPAIGASLAEKGALSEDTWNKILQKMKSCTFYGVLSDFQDDVHELSNLTAMLKQKITDLQKAAQAGVVLEVVEMNQVNNFKVEFAKLYTAWNNFQMKFLASALISTEVYYAFNGYGTLASDVQKSAVG